MRQRTGRIAGAQQPDDAEHGELHPDDVNVDDRGFTIVEVVMTIVLIALTVLPILDATFTSVKASSTVREIAEIDTMLQNAADRVNHARTDCDYSIYVQAAALAKGWEASKVTATYQHYEPGASAGAADPGSWQPGACVDGVRTPRLIQLVTITAHSDSGTIQRTIQVVKSDV